MISRQHDDAITERLRQERRARTAAPEIADPVPPAAEADERRREAFAAGWLACLTDNFPGATLDVEEGVQIALAYDEWTTGTGAPDE